MNYINRVCLTFLISLTFSSCTKFLEIDPPESDIKREEVFNDDNTATAAVLGIYSDWASLGFACGDPTSVSSLVGLSSDELVNYLKQDLSILQFESNSLQGDNVYLLQLWTSLYRSIYRANSIIEGAGQSVVLTKEVRDQIMGEAYFIRAFCNFYLVNLYGEVPLVMTTDYDANSNIGKESREVIYNQILKDVEIARDMLPEIYVAQRRERIRANKYAAYALSARIYLYLQNWVKAEEMADSVIAQVSLYSIEPDLDRVFIKNNKEAILQIRPITDGDNGCTNEGRFFGDDKVLNYNVVNEKIFDVFEIDDLRRDHWFRSIVSDNDTVYTLFKYKQDRTDIPVTEYSTVLRLAEQYLIRAEARARLGTLIGDNSSASDINVIRSRAGLMETESVTEADLLRDIANERRVELFAEWGHRWLDLKRTETAVQVLQASKDNFDPDDLIFPIPESEYLKNPGLR